MDIQVILIFILALLTINLIVVGVYVVLVLRDLRTTVKRVNSVLEGVGSVSDFIQNPLNLISGIVSAFTSSYKSIQSVRSIRKDKNVSKK